MGEPKHIGNRRDKPELCHGNAETGRGAGDAKIAGDGDNASAAHRISLNHRYDGLGQAAQCRLQQFGVGIVIERGLRRRERFTKFPDIRT